MSDELKKEIATLSLKEIYSLYESVGNTRKQVQSTKVEIVPQDLKPKRKKRGSKN